MKTRSFKNTVLVVNGNEITGWAEGDDVISIKRLADSASHKIGADGKMVVSISADRSAEVTFKLQETSSSNAFLNGLRELQEAGADSFIPVSVLFQDTFRNDLAEASNGYIKRASDMTRGVGVNTQEWTIVVEDLSMEFGG